jgi:hypothetical protein
MLAPLAACINEQGVSSACAHLLPLKARGRAFSHIILIHCAPQ